MQRIALLLGAGASCSFKYPTTKQFFEQMKIVDNLQQQIFTKIKQLPNIKDIEHVLPILDNILSLSKSPSTQSFFEATIPTVQLVSNQINWQQYTEKCKQLKSLIIDEIYTNYQFKKETEIEAFNAYDKLLNILNNNNSVAKDLFILNYDRLIEEYFIDRRKDFIDGFSQVNNHRRLWDKNAFNPEIDVESKTPFKVFKLHGSLCWREYENTIECVTTEEPSRSTYHKRNIFIYPTEYCNVNQEPYNTMYMFFNQLKERADILVVIGYAFRDEPINNVIRDFLKQPRETRAIIISPSSIEDIKNLINEAQMKLYGNRLLLSKSEFPKNQSFDELTKAIENAIFSINKISKKDIKT